MREDSRRLLYVASLHHFAQEDEGQCVAATEEDEYGVSLDCLRTLNLALDYVGLEMCLTRGEIVYLLIRRANTYYVC